jgi:hypothetical protein
LRDRLPRHDRQHEDIRLRDSPSLQLDVCRREHRPADPLPPDVPADDLEQGTDPQLVDRSWSRRHEQLTVDELEPLTRRGRVHEGAHLGGRPSLGGLGWHSHSLLG